MNVIIYPSKPCGEVSAPPSKSLFHRYLICASLSENSKIYSVPYCDDLKATANCLSLLGAKIKEENGAFYTGKLNPFKLESGINLNCNESGSTLRFLIPLCLLSGVPVTFSGTKKLLSRPLSVYENLCRENGFTYKKDETQLTVCGKLKSGYYKIDGSVSSQYVSGLMFSLPLLDGNSTLEIINKAESLSYIDLTVKTLCDFGIEIIKKENNIYEIPGNQKFKNRDIFIEGDYSNGAVLSALNYIGGKVTVNNLKTDSLQGDRIFGKLFCELKNGNCTVDIADCPDLAPVLFVLALNFHGATFINTRRLRYKESDRIDSMKTELKKFGADIFVNENSVTVPKTAVKKPTEILDSHNDHRIVTALSLLCILTGGEIKNAEAVNKSYPRFFEDLKSLNINLTFGDENS